MPYGSTTTFFPETKNQNNKMNMQKNIILPGSCTTILIETQSNFCYLNATQNIYLQHSLVWYEVYLHTESEKTQKFIDKNTFICLVLN